MKKNKILEKRFQILKKKKKKLNLTLKKKMSLINQQVQRKKINLIISPIQKKKANLMKQKKMKIKIKQLTKTMINNINKYFKRRNLHRQIPSSPSF